METSPPQYFPKNFVRCSFLSANSLQIDAMSISSVFNSGALCASELQRASQVVLETSGLGSRDFMRSSRLPVAADLADDFVCYRVGTLDRQGFSFAQAYFILTRFNELSSHGDIMLYHKAFLYRSIQCLLQKLLLLNIAINVKLVNIFF